MSLPTKCDGKSIRTLLHRHLASILSEILLALPCCIQCSEQSHNNAYYDLSPVWESSWFLPSSNNDPSTGHHSLHVCLWGHTTPMPSPLHTQHWPEQEHPPLALQGQLGLSWWQWVGDEPGRWLLPLICGVIPVKTRSLSLATGGGRYGGMSLGKGTVLASGSCQCQEDPKLLILSPRSGPMIVENILHNMIWRRSSHKNSCKCIYHVLLCERIDARVLNAVNMS